MGPVMRVCQVKHEVSLENPGVVNAYLGSKGSGIRAVLGPPLTAGVSAGNRLECLLAHHPEDRPLLNMKWKDGLHVDTALPFGLRSALRYTSVDEAVQAILTLGLGPEVWQQSGCWGHVPSEEPVLVLGPLQYASSGPAHFRGRQWGSWCSISASFRSQVPNANKDPTALPPELEETLVGSQPDCTSSRWRTC